MNVNKVALILILAGLMVSYCSCDIALERELTEKRNTGKLRKACSPRGNRVLPATRVDTTQRLKALRAIMTNLTITKDYILDVYIIPSQDEHQTEFTSEYDRRREFISGFSGSYGDAFVTKNDATLWTDTRYHLQADDQLDCNWRLMIEGFVNVTSVTEWLKHELKPGAKIGVDPKLLPQSTWWNYTRELAKVNISLVPVELNLIDLLWNSSNGRFPKRNKDVFILEDKYSGKHWTTKVELLREELRKLGADAMAVTALDEIAWLLNIRGRDIPFSPFVRSYLIVEMHKIKFYVNETQLVKHHILKYFESTRKQTKNTVIIVNYHHICNDLRTFSQVYSKILIPSQYVHSLGASHYIYNCSVANQSNRRKILNYPSPIIFLKAKKNPTEIQGMYNAHIRDAAAMCEFFSYFETRVRTGDNFTELEIVKTLNEFRFEQKDSLGNSFRTIAAYGSNGAMPHYEPTPNTNMKINKDSTLVLDSGGQYYDGTTDVTRTLHLGTPTKEEKDAYTRVLIGQIQLSSLIFPENMASSVADVMARAPLWEVGLDYLHQTSHGIGSFLSVHESPISLYYDNPPLFPRTQELQPGYFLSNEPGFYREGVFGIRLENVMEVVKKSLPSFNGQYFLGFKTVTLVPYEPKLIDLSLLSFKERRWLNNYNDQIRRHVGAELRRQNFIDGYDWMMEKTEYIPEYGHGSIVISQSILVLSANAIFVLVWSNFVF